LFVVPRITVPISILLPILIFGLIRYYSTSKIYANTHDADSNLNHNGLNDIHEQDRKRQNGAVASIFFAAIFAVLIVIFAFSGSDNFHVFIEWNEIGVIGIIQLVVAVALCFFIPGFAIVLILTRKYQMNPILTVLLAYFFSILISGLSAYIWALGFDTPISELKNFYIMLYSGILVIFLIFHSRFKITTRLDMRVQLDSSFHQFVSSAPTQFLVYVKKKYPELLVFGSILMLLIISTYYLYNAVTISDQWFHQGRALLFLSGSFRETVIDGSDDLGYPPFQSGLLAALTTIAGVPIVNSYASIAFLNLVPVFAFYYFFSKWVPPKYYRATLLASSLFAIASGFNWIYLLGLTVTSNPITSQHSFLEILNSLRTVTIIRPTNFIFSAEPDFSTGLIYLALPAGLALLGVIQQRFNAKLHYVAIVAALSIVGILSHFEFFLFILVAALLPVIFKLEKQTYLYVGLMFSFLVVFLINTVLPGNYYSSDLFFGFSLLYLVVIFVSLAWVFYLALGKFRHLQIKLSTLHDLSRKFPKIKNRSYVLLGVLLISLTVYMFFLSYNVLVHVSTDYLKKNTEGYVVPWYVYSIKLGLPGLLGLVFIFSYFIKKFDNKLFVFGVLIIMALITGNFYDEHRFSKFVMLGTVAYASLLIYRIIKLDYINKIYLNGVLISALIVSSVLSVVLYIGSNSLVLQTKDFTINPKRNFPQMSEIRLYDKLLNSTDIGSKKYNIVSFPSEYNFVQGSPLMSKLQGFSGFPPETIFRNPLSLNSSTLDEFYRQLEDSDVRYILLPKASIKDKILLGEPIRFALQYFNRFYEDKDYIILQVRPLKAPSLSPDAQVALLYDLGSDLPSPQVHNTILLPYNNNTFDFGDINQSRAIQKNPQGENVTLLGSNVENGIPLWSRVIPPEQKINYIETKFRITSENENKSKSNDIRLKWWEGDKEYYVLLSKNGLELYRQSISNQSDRIILAKNPEVDKTIGKWYEVKIARSNSSINVFLDDVPKIQVASPLIGIQNKSISRIGLTTLLNNVEFGPIKMAYEGSNLLPPQVQNTTLLPYNNNTFIFRTTNESKIIQKNPQDENVSLLGSKIDKGIPLWSRVIPPEQKINYIETKFRITSENENKSKSNDIRLKWRVADKEYYILFSNKGLELYQQSVSNQSDRKILAKNPWLEKTIGKWYGVKIARSNGSINVFVDDVPEIQIASPLIGIQNESISRIGLTTLLNNVEFGPIMIGKVGKVPSQNYNETKYYDFYYPLSLLALSQTSYDIFNDEDLSAFSKDTIVISDRLKLDDNKFNMYLNYVRAGGTLIVINSNNNFNSSLSQLFPLQSSNGKAQEFTSIADTKNQSDVINVKGLVNQFEMQPSSDLKVIATYKNNDNQTIAPFAIEKRFPDNGRIVFINAAGYFDAISAAPRQYFHSLENFSEILGVKKEPGKQVSLSADDKAKATSNGFIRNMDLNGMMTLNSSSVLLADNTGYPYPVNAFRVDIFNKTNSPLVTLHNVTIKDLNMIGRYNASIDFNGRIELPDSMSDRSYFGILIPTDFNMTLNLYPKGLSYIEIVTENGTSSNSNSIKVNGTSKIEFHKVRPNPPLKYIPVLLKNPEIKIYGETNISNGLQNGFLTKRGTLNTGSPLNIKGQLNAKFGFVDNYNQYYKNGTLINYITYLQAMTVNNTIQNYTRTLLVPADFISLLQDRELDMALQNALVSPSNIIVVVVLSIVTIITIRIVQKNKNL
jgi:hypothetical protein